MEEKPIKKIYATVIHGDKKITEFMQACDLFDNAKIIGKIDEITLDIKPGVNLAENSYLRSVVENLKNAYEHAGHNVAFVHIVHVQDDNIIVLNNKGNVKPYINKKIRQISDGKKSFIFEEFLKRIGIKVETDEHRFIINY